jgi:hypothetical protein
VDIFLVLFFLWLLYFCGDRFSLFLGRNKFCEFDVLSQFSDGVSAGFGAEVCWMRDVEDFGSHNCHGCNESAEQVILRVEDGEIFWGPFREFPEGLAFFGLKVQWIGVKKLFDVVFEVFIELFGSVSDAIVEINGSIQQKLEAFAEGFGLVRSTNIFRIF